MLAKFVDRSKLFGFQRGTPIRKEGETSGAPPDMRWRERKASSPEAERPERKAAPKGAKSNGWLEVHCLGYEA